MDSHNICKDNHNILNCKGSRSIWNMDNNILMGIYMDHIKEDMMILMEQMIHDDQVVSRTQQIQQGLIGHHHQYQFF